MFKLATLILVIWVRNSFKAQAQIPTDSIDYWIGNISPRCAISIIYFELTSDFIFKSAHNIPVMFVPLQYNRTKKLGKFYNYLDLDEHKFFNGGIRFMKSECYFSVLHYKLLNDFENTTTDDIFLYKIVTNTAHAFTNFHIYDSNSTYCLILYHGIERNDEDLRFEKLIKDNMEMNLALVYLSNNLKSGYNVYCKTPSMKFEVAARNVLNEVKSIVDQKFMEACSSQYTYVFLNEHNSIGVYDSKLLVYEHEIITSILLKTNVSMPSEIQQRYESYYSNPRVVVSDFEKTLSLFPTFDNSIRFFTCYSLPGLSFRFYVSAFETRVWIAIILSGILIATFLKCHIFYNLSTTLNFSTFLFYFSIFMEESFSIPSTIGNNNVYRTATILWLLTAIVLTNTYISHVISGLNAPLVGKRLENKELYGNLSEEPKIELEYFEKHFGLLFDLQLDSSRFFDGFLTSFVEKLHSTQTSTSGYTFLSESLRLSYPEDVWMHLKNPFIYSGFYENILQSDLCILNFNLKQTSFCRALMNSMRVSNKYYPTGHANKRPWNSSDYPTGAVEGELIKCQKSVFMEKSHQLEFKYVSESFPKKRFYYLQQDRLTSTQKKWGFYNLQKSKLPFYFSMFLQSGIFHELHKLKLLGDHLKRRSMTSEIIKRTHKPEVLDMTSSVQTVFILYAAMILLAKLAFIAEFGYSTFNKHNILRLKMKLKKLAVGAKLPCHTLKNRSILRFSFLRGSKTNFSKDNFI